MPIFPIPFRIRLASFEENFCLPSIDNPLTFIPPIKCYTEIIEKATRSNQPIIKEVTDVQQNFGRL